MDLNTFVITQPLILEHLVKSELEEIGIPGAFIAGEYNGKTISAQDAQDILTE